MELSGPFGAWSFFAKPAWDNAPGKQHYNPKSFKPRIQNLKSRIQNSKSRI
jgi:hypothetical protein